MITAVQNKRINNHSSRQVVFRGFNDQTYRVKSGNKMDWCLHETAFFRNIETLEFLSDKILKEFQQGTHIADFGCSNGEELYSIMMLLNNKNKDKRYKGTGFDIAPKVVRMAQNGPFEIKYRFIEGFINDNTEYKASDRKHLKNIFDSCFTNLDDKFVQNAKQFYNQELLDKEIAKENDYSRLLKLKCFKELSLHYRSHCNFDRGNAYVPKGDFVKDSINFKIGDIKNLSKEVAQCGKTGVLVFKNAWYHVLGSRHTFDISKLNIKGARDIMKKAYEVLPINGLFVVGNLENDHLYDNQNGRFIVQNEKNIKVCDDTYFHQMLKNEGFMPIFYEQVKDKAGLVSKDSIYLPSVWQKIARSL